MVAKRVNSITLFHGYPIKVTRYLVLQGKSVETEIRDFTNNLEYKVERRFS